MDPSSAGNSETLICNVCRYPGSDLRLVGCGCTVHARCAPLSLVMDEHSKAGQEFGAFPAPNRSQSVICPVCRSGAVTGLYLVPLSFRDLERAVELRKATALAKPNNSHVALGKKHPREEEPDIHAEAAYLLLSKGHSLSNSGIPDREQQRTGRWTDEEISFVDYLVSAFDQGCLPLPHGIKLNEFLGDMLLCKSSRLTKKMKNAKLSTRSFVLSSPALASGKNDNLLLSSLHEKFLMSVTAEPTQLELRFNLTKQWRTHFSNLCVQVGYPYLDGKDWIASLEELENRASKAEDLVRRVRRKRMGMALLTDGGKTANPMVFIGGVKAEDAASQLEPVLSIDSGKSQEASARKISTDQGNPSSEAKNGEEDDMFSMLDFSGDSSGQQRGRGSSFSVDDFRRPRTFSEDFDAVLSDLMEPEPATVPDEKEYEKIPPKSMHSSNSGRSSPNHSCGAFLDAIIHYMENRNLPFQHADVWVPSFLPRETNGPSKAVDTEQLRLFHAGHATRGDLDDSLAYSLHEFGVYSDNFSFEPGHGLPGRVYVSGEASWESHIDEADPKIFERAGGAKVYGVKTAVGIPVCTPLVGRIIVAMYSREHVPENKQLSIECSRELMKYSPEPKWKLVIDMDDGSNANESKLSNKPNTMWKLPPLEVSKATSPPAAFPTQLVGCTSPTGINETRPDNEEQKIISLLGEHMPLSESSVGETSSSVGHSSNLLPHFMSIRLLLLRPSSRRTAKENELIDILKNSFRAYSKDNRRSGAELANLLAKDWICLKTSVVTPQTNNNFDPALEPKPMPPARRHSSASIDATKMPQMMNSTIYSMAGPMNPPAQFVSPPTPLAPFGYKSSNDQGGSNSRGNNHKPSFDGGMYRTSSIGSNISRRSSSIDDNSQRSVQPQPVQSSSKNNNVRIANSPV